MHISPVNLYMSNRYVLFPPWWKLSFFFFNSSLMEISPVSNFTVHPTWDLIFSRFSLTMAAVRNSNPWAQIRNPYITYDDVASTFRSQHANINIRDYPALTRHRCNSFPSVHSLPLTISSVDMINLSASFNLFMCVHKGVNWRLQVKRFLSLSVMEKAPESFRRLGEKKRRRNFALIGSPNTCYSVLFKSFSPENRTPQRFLKLGKSAVKIYDLNDMKRKSTFYTPLQGSCKSYVLSFSLMHYGPLQS